MIKKNIGIIVFICSFGLFVLFVMLFQTYSWLVINKSQQQANLLDYAGNVYKNHLSGYQQQWSVLTKESFWVEILKNDDRGNYFLDSLSHVLGEGLIYIVDTNGVVTHASLEGRSDDLVGTDLSFRPYVENALKGESSLYSALGVVTNKLGVYFAEPVFDGDQVSFVLVLKIQAEKILENIKPCNDEVIWVTDQYGVILASTNKDLVLKSYPNLTTAALMHIRNKRNYPDVNIYPLTISSYGDWSIWDGRRGLVDQLDLSIPGWHLYSFRYRESFNPIANSQKYLLMAFLIISFFFSLTLSILTMDIKRRIAIEKELEAIAHTDPLTGLLNRRYCVAKLKTMIDRSSRGQLNFSLCYVDLNYLKLVNDEFGHNAGDKYIKSVCSVIEKHTRTSDIFCRVGGDEFIVIHPRTSYDEVQSIWERIGKTIDEMSNENDLHRYSISYGIVEYNTASSQTAMELVDMADKVMYKRKIAYKNSDDGSQDTFLKRN
ncbi:sensor domain-containing diguanylate cyclase [Spirochaeta cellobiosiphila]|uniref:sensor domain-containing diguanylate cyclase n=1 Tax=Spirochaeta cellobiosiphila TaxID=504483 RepID=UPI00040B5F96|nr:diguanylate cyclase [Spirochaeta cellobiosiphila]